MPMMRDLPDLEDVMGGDPFGEAVEIDDRGRVDQTGTTEEVSKAELERFQVAFERSAATRRRTHVTEWMNSRSTANTECAFSFKRASRRTVPTPGRVDWPRRKYLDGRKAANLLGYPVDPAEPARDRYESTSVCKTREKGVTHHGNQSRKGKGKVSARAKRKAAPKPKARPRARRPVGGVSAQSKSY